MSRELRQMKEEGHEPSFNSLLPPIKGAKEEYANLNTGLALLTNKQVPIMQWIGTFALEQYKHQQLQKQRQKKIMDAKSTYGKKIVNNFKSLMTEMCPLCMSEKYKEQMQSISNCKHKFCYSCLNSYAISRIQDMMIVVCPHPNCGCSMTLNSITYRYLPEPVKIKFLQNKQVFKYNKLQQENRCPRCLKNRHEGYCKAVMNPTTLQKSFNFRQCKKCSHQAHIRDGKKKVTCDSCEHVFCYVCGENWANGARGNHVCGTKEKLIQLQKQWRQGEHECCECCNCEVGANCVNCQCCCQDGFGDRMHCCDNFSGSNCCQHLFYCQRFSIMCVICNVCSIPVRIFIISAVFLMMLILMLPLSLVLVFWILMNLVVGCIIGPIQFVTEKDCPVSICGLICCPFIGLFTCLKGMNDSTEVPRQMFCSPMRSYCQTMKQVWIAFSPKTCST